MSECLESNNNKSYNKDQRSTTCCCSVRETPKGPLFVVQNKAEDDDLAFLVAGWSMTAVVRRFFQHLLADQSDDDRDECLPQVKGPHFFGLRTSSIAEMARYALTLETDDGEIQVNAWQQEPFSVNIAAVPEVVADRWAASGVTLADQAGPDVSPEIHLLVGADIATSPLMERKIVDGATAWRTRLGWVLSGPQTPLSRELPKRSEEIAVAYVAARSSSLDAHVQRLFEIEEFPTTCDHPTGPVFPLRKEERVGLLWKGEERPAENREQAHALARRQVERLAKERRDEYEGVLIKEYGKLDAIEEDPDPSETGYYLPHHVVICEDSASTKV